MQQSESALDKDDAPTPSTSAPAVFTVEQFSRRHPAFTNAALRNLIWKGETRHSTKGTIQPNGILESGAIIRLGRRVLIDEAKFFDWMRSCSQQKLAA